MILTTDSRIIGIDSSNKQVRLCRFEVDDISELPAPDVWTSDGVIICMGSTAHVIGDNSEHMLDSSGQWVQQVAGTSSYTRAEIDALLLDKVDTSTYATDKAAIEAEIAAVENAGSKNLFNIDATPVVNHTVFTLSDGKLTVTANGNWAHYSVPLNLPAGNYILSTVISGYSKASGAPDTSMRLRMSATTSGTTYIVLQTITGNGATNVPFTWTGGTIYLQFYPNFNATAYANSFAAENTMIRPAAITDPVFQQYSPTNRELYEMILALQSGTRSLSMQPETLTEER